MKLHQLLIGLLITLYTLLFSQNIAERVAGSPFPVSQIPDTLYLIDDYAFSEGKLFTLQTLQGFLAKTKPIIYRDRGAGHSIWLEDLIANYEIFVDSSYKKDFPGIITHFINEVEGYILCNLNDNSSNSAISLCGLMNAIAVTPDNVELMDSLNIPEIMDVREKDEAWVLNNYDSLLSTQIITYQKENKNLFLGDYSIFAKAFHFFDDLNNSLTETAFERMDNGSSLFGWGNDEINTVSMASSNSIHVHPADWAINLSTLSNLSVELEQKNDTENIDTSENVHTVCFVMTDGDNIQWVLNDFATSQNWYGSTSRGELNMGWTISPSLSELAPSVLKYLYQNVANNSSGRDYFIAGPSGLGYIYPDKFPALDSSALLLNRFMDKADLNIVNIIGHDSSHKYLEPYLQQSNIDAIFYYDYSNYSGLNGDIFWINGKPVIGARYNFWEGFQSAASLADNLNTLPKRADSEQSYSLIPVHAWSTTVDNVLECVNMLDSNVVVVTPGQFIKRINKFLAPQSGIEEKSNIPGKTSLFQNYPNPFNSETTISFSLANSADVRLCIYDLQGKKIAQIANDTFSAGRHAIDWDAQNLSSGLYFYSLQNEINCKSRSMLLLK
ncbi:MAG TPA: T9SS type A sorting domain-containing protein [bacterium]|nr:T9SS type A sorting domain-containing protein [bacterium]